MDDSGMTGTIAESKVVTIGGTLSAAESQGFIEAGTTGPVVTTRKEYRRPAGCSVRHGHHP